MAHSRRPALPQLDAHARAQHRAAAGWLAAAALSPTLATAAAWVHTEATFSPRYFAGSFWCATFTALYRVGELASRALGLALLTCAFR